MKSEYCGESHPNGKECSLAKNHQKCDEMRIQKHIAIGEDGTIYVSW